MKKKFLNLREFVCQKGVFGLYILLLLPYLFAVFNLQKTFEKASEVSQKADSIFAIVSSDGVKSQLKKSANEVAGAVVVSTNSDVGDKLLENNSLQKSLEKNSVVLNVGEQSKGNVDKLSSAFSDPLKLDYVDYYLKKFFPCENCVEGQKHYILKWFEGNVVSFFKSNIWIYVFIFSFIPIISVWAILAMIFRFLIKPFLLKYDNLNQKDLVKNHLYNIKSIYWENFILSILGVFTAVAIVGVIVVLFAHFRYLYRCIRGLRMYSSAKLVKFF